MYVPSRACMWACVLLVVCSINHNNPRCVSHLLFPQWSLPETRVWQVWVGSASQPCRADVIPTLQMGTLRLVEVKGPTWDSHPDSRVCRHSSSVPPSLWKVGVWFSSPTRLHGGDSLLFADSCSHILHWSCGAWGGLLGGLVVRWVHTPARPCLQTLAVSPPPAVGLGQAGQFPHPSPRSEIR